MKLGYVVFLGISLLFLPQQALAQVLPNAELFAIGISPAYPRPFDTISITPQSSNLDLSASTITTTVNGVKVGETTGRQSIQVRMGDAGQKTTIAMTVKVNGTTQTLTKTIYPAGVAVVLEPTTTTHALYQGAALVAPEGRVRLIAIPNFKGADGKNIPSQTLVYTWRLGNKVLESESGIGRSILTATAPVRYRDAEMTLMVSTQDGSRVAQTELVVSAAEPIVRIYRNDPLLGPDFSTALTNSFSMPDAEETFRAVPYYFKSMPTFAWSVNNTASSAEQDVTVRETGQGAGTANLSVYAKGSALDSASNALSVTFGTAKSRGFFGF